MTTVTECATCRTPAIWTGRWRVPERCEGADDLDRSAPLPREAVCGCGRWRRRVDAGWVAWSEDATPDEGDAGVVWRSRSPRRPCTT